MKRLAPSAGLHPTSLEPQPVATSGPCLTGLGWPVEHGVSPAMHKSAFEALGLDGCYTLLPTQPQKVADTVASLKRRGYCGANVTLPHKQAVMPHLDELTAAARAIGAGTTWGLAQTRQPFSRSKGVRLRYQIQLQRKRLTQNLARYWSV